MSDTSITPNFEPLTMGVYIENGVVKEPATEIKFTDQKTNQVATKAFMKADVTSKTRGLDGIKELFSGIGSALKGIAKKVVRSTAKLFGHSKSKSQFDIPDKLAQSQLETIGKKLTSNESLEDIKEELKNFEFSNNIENSGEQLYFEKAILILKSGLEGLDGFDKLASENRDPIVKKVIKNLKQTFEKVGTENPTSKLTKEIKKSFTDAIKTETLTKSVAKEWTELFEENFDAARGRLVPKELSHTFEVNNESYTEKANSLDTSVGAKFLELVNDDDKYDKQIGFIKNQSDGVRLSTMKKAKGAQGMLINGHNHSISKDGKQVDTVQRSGAFAIHGEPKPGIDLLKKWQSALEKGGKKVDKLLKKIQEKWKMPKASKSKIQTLLNEKIQRRTDLCVAQGLPKIVAGIKSVLKNNDAFKQALKTDSFLYVEQTFLSTANAGEKSMVEDMKGALDFIRENVQIRLTNDPNSEGIEKTPDGKYVLILQTDNEVEDKTFNLESHLFVQGVNEFQSIGNIFNAKAANYQDSINTNSLNALATYMNKGIDEWNASDVSQKLKNHFNKESRRKGKDIEGVRLLNQTVKQLGGARGISCKSGKDRTGSHMNDTLSTSVASDPDTRKAIKKELDGGISYTNTGYNTGKANAYAFNEFQSGTLKLKPSQKYCGNVPS